MTKVKTIQLVPIGYVKNGVTACAAGEMRNVVSNIVIDSQYEQMLTGVEEYSHLYILFWFHRRSGEMDGVAMVHPRRREDLPLVGVFAARSPVRPNPIGLTMVELLQRQGRILTVRGLDALDGTPVIDIKPPSLRESRLAIRFPGWVFQL